MSGAQSRVGPSASDGSSLVREFSVCSREACQRCPPVVLTTHGQRGYPIFSLLPPQFCFLSVERMAKSDRFQNAEHGNLFSLSFCFLAEARVALP